MSTTIRLLIADDNEDLAETISCRFTRLGAEVVCCGDADACLELFAGCPPDVALVDGKLPGSEGTWLVQQLRALRPDVPLVMLSGNADRPFIDAAYEAGVVQFLLKPCSLATVVSAVLQAAELRHEQHGQVGRSFAETLT